MLVVISLLSISAATEVHVSPAGNDANAGSALQPVATPQRARDLVRGRITGGLSEPVETAFANLNLGAGICTMDRVIAVGAASVEGTSVQNTFLSHTRGHALKAAIAANLPCEAGAVAATVLDLGYNRAEVTCPAGQKVCSDLSAPQRPIAMIFADAREPGTDIGEALRSGIAAHEASGASVLPGVLVSDYSAFDLR